MTLFIGTPHWNAICFNSDTRVTNVRTNTYKDNALKMSHVHGGIGMVASGDKSSAVMVRETTRKYLDDFAKTNIKFPPSVDLQNVMSGLLLESLKKLRDHPFNLKRPIYEVKSKGLFGVNISDQPLTLNTEEAKNLIKILVEGKKINDIYSKNIDQISKCANGQLEKAVLKDFQQHTLFTYRVKLFDDPDSDIYEIKKVPFGKLIAFGSGSEFDYSIIESHVLSYVLFDTNGADTQNGAFHLGMIHHYAEEKVPLDDRFDFRTFGGAIIAGTIVTDKANMGRTDILLGELKSKRTGLIFSKVYEKNGNLWVQTQSGKNLELDMFPEKLSFNEMFSL